MSSKRILSLAAGLVAAALSVIVLTAGPSSADTGTVVCPTTMSWQTVCS